MAELNGVEIFAEGTWNGNNISKDVLDNLVSAFNATKDFVKPVLKLGHDNDQILLQKDGMPAAGWVSNVYVRGKKLFADFVDIPEKIYELIKKKAYRKVSVEIFSGYSFDGKTYPNLLAAVALLGADTPAVMTLSDILDRYNLQAKNFTNDPNSNNIEVKIYSSDLKVDGISENFEQMPDDKMRKKMQEMIDQMKQKIDDLQGRLDDMSKDKKSSDDNYSVYKKETEEKISRLEKEKEETEIEKYTIDLQSKNLTAPSMVPFVKALLGVNKSEFSVGDKKLSTKEVVENLLSLAKEVFSINKQENSKNLEPEEKNKVSAIETKIEEYMTTHKVSYSAAYRAVMKNAA